MLVDEVQASQRLVRTDAYQMSIGEIVNMYKDGELLINPDFQRLFRWEIGQKSKLIESILLGIPLPPIFVFEKEDSKWELIDGLQRTSTILEFMGLLKEPEGGKFRKPSILEGTKYLPSLKNTVWEVSELIGDVEADKQVPIGKSFQLAIRRARLGVEILKRPSDNNTKFDLFQRLNSAGTPANPQELRNCVIIMVSPSYFEFLKRMAALPSFKKVMKISDEHEVQQKHLEYISRFLTHVYYPYNGKLDVEAYIDEGIRTLAENGEIADAEKCFQWTFDTLAKVYGQDALRRTDGDGRHVGKIGLAAFECIAVGIARNYHNYLDSHVGEDVIKAKIDAFWKQTEIERFFELGLRGTIRIQRTVDFGARWFKP